MADRSAEEHTRRGQALVDLVTAVDHGMDAVARALPAIGDGRVTLPEEVGTEGADLAEEARGDVHGAELLTQRRGAEGEPGELQSGAAEWSILHEVGPPPKRVAVCAALWGHAIDWGRLLPLCGPSLLVVE